jgi:hypothetical protein
MISCWAGCGSSLNIGAVGGASFSPDEHRAIGANLNVSSASLFGGADGAGDISLRN